MATSSSRSIQLANIRLDLQAVNPGDAAAIAATRRGSSRRWSCSTTTATAPSPRWRRRPASTATASGWGNALLDFDNDGWPDLFFTGAFPNPFDPSVFLGPDGEGNYGVLWRNNHDGSWTDLSATLPHDFRHDYSSGVAVGDYDGDGFEDLVVMLTLLPPLANSGQPVLLHNKGNGNHWLKVHAVGTVSNRDGVGARVAMTSGNLTQTQEIYAGSSLGRRTAGTVDVRWPSGFHNRIYDVQAREELTFTEIPCSYDAPQSFHDYHRCVANALGSLQQKGLVRPDQVGRILSSSTRAWHDAH